jgi:hypothetical protein
LVLWLDEDVLTAGRKPIGALVRLRERFPRNLDGSKFALLGPEDSSMLSAMLHENRGGSDAGFSVYNFGATAEEKQIANGGHVQDGLKQAGIRNYYRSVNSDDELAGILACELMRRDANLRLPYDEKQCKAVPAGDQARDHVVLISDWDTVYGNDLLRTVANTFGAAENGKADDPPWVVTESYERGLDGRLPDPKHPKQPKPQSDDSDQTAKQPAAATPETASQFEGAEGKASSTIYAASPIV